MSELIGEFFCPKCNVKTAVWHQHANTIIPSLQWRYQKNKWSFKVNFIFPMFQMTGMDKDNWSIYGTLEDWNNIKYWECEKCGHSEKSFVGFIKNYPNCLSQYDPTIPISEENNNQ